MSDEQGQPARMPDPGTPFPVVAVGSNTFERRPNDPQFTVYSPSSGKAYSLGNQDRFDYVMGFSARVQQAGLSAKFGYGGVEADPQHTPFPHDWPMIGFNSAGQNVPDVKSVYTAVAKSGNSLIFTLGGNAVHLQSVTIPFNNASDRDKAHGFAEAFLTNGFDSPCIVTNMLPAASGNQNERLATSPSGGAFTLFFYMAPKS